MLHIICLIILLSAVTLFVKYLNRVGHSGKFRTILSGILVIYIMGYLYFVFFSRVRSSESRFNLVPFQSYVHLFDRSLDSKKYATGFKAIGLEAESPAVGILLNILLYYPLGYILPFLFPKLKSKHVILIGCICSIATEAIQYLLKMGWCEADDVIHNSLGTGLGVWIWLWQSKRFDAQRSANLRKSEP